MRVRPLRSDLRAYLERRHLSRKFEKQRRLFEENPRHPSLRTERLEPPSLRIYSFRMDRKYRAIFIISGGEEVEIVNIKTITINEL